MNAINKVFVPKITKVKQYGKKQAQDMIKINTFHAQRNIKASRLDEFSKAMLSGSIRWEPISIAVQKHKNNQEVLVDGQMRNTAIFNHDVVVPEIEVHKFDCNSDEEVGELFGTFDPSGSARTFREVADASGYERIVDGIILKKDLTLAFKVFTELSFKCVKITGGKVGGKPDKHAVLKSAVLYAKPLSKYFEIVEPIKKINPGLYKSLRYVSVAALGSVTLRNEVITGWEHLFDPSELNSKGVIQAIINQPQSAEIFWQNVTQYAGKNTYTDTHKSQCSTELAISLIALGAKQVKQQSVGTGYKNAQAYLTEYYWNALMDGGPTKKWSWNKVYGRNWEEFKSLHRPVSLTGCVI